MSHIRRKPTFQSGNMEVIPISQGTCYGGVFDDNSVWYIFLYKNNVVGTYLKCLCKAPDHFFGCK